LIDGKAVRELHPNLIAALHCDNTSAEYNPQGEEYKPHFSVSGSAISANLRGANLPTSAIEWHARFNTGQNNHSNKFKSKAGQSHSFMRVTQDSLQAS